MALKKTIAIIGATSERGSAIAKFLAKANHRLLLMSDDAEALTVLRNKLSPSTAEIEAVSCAKDACWEADIIIVATPYKDEREVASKIKEVAVGKIVISISNPVDQNYEHLFPSANNSAAEELQRLLPYSKVVKTFNTSFLENFVPPVIKGQTADTFIAGNNGDAIETVSELVKSAGFNPFVVGDLSMSRAMERIQLVIAGRSIKNNFNWLAN